MVTKKELAWQFVNGSECRFPYVKEAFCDIMSEICGGKEDHRRKKDYVKAIIHFCRKQKRNND